jgi:amino acid efflux transporter
VAASTSERMTTADGAALYVGAVLGPGVLIVPALAVSIAGPASVVAWIALLALSAPVAATFAALGIRQPVAGGAAAYVDSAFGPQMGAGTGWCFLGGVVLGAPTLSIVGGEYFGAVVGGGRAVVLATSAAMLMGIIAANLCGFRATSRIQLALVGTLTALILVALVAALPHAHRSAWSPFAPHGWVAVGTAANLLMFSFVGWEAVTHVVDRFANPSRQIPRAIASAFVIIAALYIGIAVAAVGLPGNGRSTVPLADLMASGLGQAGRKSTAVVAVLLTMGTVNAYIAGATSLAVDMNRRGQFPLSAMSGPACRYQARRRVLMLIAGASGIVFVLLADKLANVTLLIRIISTLFVAVYVAACAAAIHLLNGKARLVGMAAFALVVTVLAFAQLLIAVPAAVMLAACLYITITTRLRESAAGGHRGLGERKD